MTIYKLFQADDGEILSAEEMKLGRVYEIAFAGTSVPVSLPKENAVEIRLGQAMGHIGADLCVPHLGEDWNISVDAAICRELGTITRVLSDGETVLELCGLAEGEQSFMAVMRLDNAIAPGMKK